MNEQQVLQMIKNNIYPIIALFSSLLIGGYVVLSYSNLGLILWEFSQILAFYMIIPTLVGFLLFVQSNRPSYGKSWFLGIIILNLLLFQLWAIMPCLLVQPLHQSYEEQFEETFGTDYISDIPLPVQELMSSEPFDAMKLLFLQSPSKSYLVKKDVPYGNHSSQLLDIYLPDHYVLLPSPAVILIHGEKTWEGASKEGVPELETATFFTAQGLVVISIEYRPPEEGTFWDKVYDIRKAIAWIHVHAAEYFIDPDLLFVLGRSRGGHLATTALSR